MKTFLFRDANELASGETANILSVNAVNPMAALAMIARWNHKDIFNKFGKVFFKNATFTTASKTLTSVGAFARYVFANSTRIIITGGTGVTPGEYVIASRSSDDAIVLTEDIGGTNPSDVSGYIIAGRTIVQIERTNDVLTAGLPKEGANEAGSGLNRGVAAGRMFNSLPAYEISIDAA